MPTLTSGTRTASFPDASCAGHIHRISHPPSRLAVVKSLLVITAICAPVAFCQPANPSQPPVEEHFDSLAYVYPRASATAYDGHCFSLDASSQLRIQTGARVSGSALQWRIVAKSSLAALAITRTVSFPTSQVRFHVKNPYHHKARISLAAVSACGGMLTWPAVDLATHAGWRPITWPASAALPSPPASYPCIPVKEWRIIISGLTPGNRYTFYIDEFSVFPQPSPPTGKIFAAAPLAQAGETIEVQVALSADRPPSPLDALVLQLLDARSRLAAFVPIRAADARQPTARLGLTIPSGLPAGQYFLALGPFGQKSFSSRRPIAIRPRSAEPIGGRIDLLSQARLIADLRLAPLPANPAPTHTYLLAATCNYDPYGAAVDVSLGTNPFLGLEATVNSLLQIDPTARIVLAIHVSAPPAWCESNERECMKLVPPPTTPLAPRARMMPSFSSSAWLSLADKDLRAFAEYLSSAPWSSHVVALLLCGGAYGTWAYPSPGSSLPDYSVPQHIAFRSFLRQYYKSLANLRAAWGQPRRPVLELLEKAPPDEPRPILSWGEIQIPSPERRRTRPMSLLEPAAAQEVVDYRRFHALAPMRAALRLAQALREMLPDRPIGIMYGSRLLEASHPGRLFSTGHSALWQALQSPAISFIALPIASSQRAGLPPAATASIRHAGKLWLALLPPAAEDSSSDARRLFAAASAMAQGASAVVVPASEACSGGSWSALATPPLPPDEKALPTPSLVVFTDPDSCLWLARNTPLAASIYDAQLIELARSGIPFQVWDARHVALAKLRSSKAYLALDCFVVSESAREDWQILRDRDHLLIFSYAAGAMKPGESLSGRDAFAFTGIPITLLSRAGPLTVRALPGIEPWTIQLADELTYGVGERVSPRFCCVDSGVEVLGLLGKSRLPALAARRFARWSSVYSAAPGIPAALLRSLLSAVGVKPVIDCSSLVACGNGLLAILPDADAEIALPAVDAVVLQLTPAGWQTLSGPGEKMSRRVRLSAGQPVVFMFACRSAPH